MECPECQVDIERAKRCLSDVWQVNRERAGRQLVRHLEHGGEVGEEDTGDIQALFLAIGLARRRVAPEIHPLLPYSVEGVLIPEN